MADLLPGTLLLPTRDDIAAAYIRDYRFRDPDAETGPGTQPDIDAQTIADVVAPIYYDAQVIANGTQDQTSEGVWLDRRGTALGVDRGEALGGSGYVTITASAGGGFIDEGIEIRHKQSGLRYRCLVADTYLDGANVPIQGIDVGPATNLAAGEVMEWTSPPIGIGTTAVVFENSDGTGLSGGRLAQEDPEYRDEIQDIRANPPASGNDAEYQAAMKRVRGLGVQQGFTYPAIDGPGTTGIVFTMRPTRPGGSRVPNAAQIAIMDGELRSHFPGDDGIFVCNLYEELVTVVLRVTWADNAAGWFDAEPWPDYVTPNVKVRNSPLPTATSFTLYTTASTPRDPEVGQTIGFYNRTTGKYARKRIGSVSTSLVSGETRWAITCDTTNNASDTSYVPVVQQVVSPWSDSLDLVSPAVTSHFDTTGPGEQLSVFYDPGTRQRRQPASPGIWPYEINERIMVGIFAMPAIARLQVAAPTMPHTATVGIPGVESYILALGDLAILST